MRGDGHSRSATQRPVWVTCIGPGACQSGIQARSIGFA